MLAPRRAAEMPFIASMGIYVVKASVMKDLLTEHFPTQHDFGSDIIPGANKLGFHVQVRQRGTRGGDCGRRRSSNLRV